jgi:hypothetical protein
MNPTFYAGWAAVLPGLLLAMGSSCGASGAGSAASGASGASSSAGGAQMSNAGGGGAASGDTGRGGSAASGGGSSSLSGAGSSGSTSSTGGSAAVGGASAAGAGTGDHTAGTGGAAGTAGATGAAGAASDSVLFVGGDSPMVGVDLQLHQVLQGMKLQVEDARETAVPTQAIGKRLVVFSYSMASSSFKAEDWASLPVPIIVLEHYLLPRLGMTKTDDHGYHDAATQIEITSDDPVFTAGMPKGKVTVYAQVGEFFWGIPAPSAVTIATVVGTPTQPVTFGYTAGSLMASMVAPARRVQVFVAVHAPPANPAQFLNADGMKLFGGAAAWAITAQ